MDYVGASQQTDQTPSNISPLPDYHVRNPIKPLLWLNDHTKLTGRTKQDLAFINGLGFNRVQIGSHIDLYLNTQLDYSGSSVSPLLDGISDSDVYIRLRIDNDVLGESKGVNVDQVISEALKVDRFLWDGMRFWDHVLKIMNALSSGRSPPTGTVLYKSIGVVRAGNYSIYVLRSGILIFTDKSRYILYDGDWVRLASDVFTQRFLFTIGCLIGKSVNGMQYPDVDLVKRVIRWGDDTLTELGNDGFKIIKTYEAIAVGVIQEKGESGIIDPGRFLKNTLQDLFDESVTYHRKAVEVVDLLRSVESIHHLTQLYGMHRIWGHPMVNSAKGMEKVINIGRKNIIKDSSLSKDAGRMFKMLFCREYKARHGHFPPVIDSQTSLSTELSEGDSRAVSNKMHSMKEWDRIVFKQLFQLPETFNLSMIVADKSISPTISELQTLVKTKKTVMSPDKRRGVKRWLEDTTLEPQKFLREVNEGRFPDDHKVIGLTPKERELNPTPRMFALMSHLLRVYVVLTEQLISDHILRYFPQITMTDSLLDLTKKMYSTVKHQSIQNKFKGKNNMWASKVVCMSLDFEKWNGHMRKEMTLGVFTALGDLFGLTEVYNVTYDIFKSCYYYLADGTYVPGVDTEGIGLTIDEPYSFTNHQGGMEGLRQKGWTLFTVCALEVILSQHDCSYKIMGMGDNQVLQITLYTNKVSSQGLATELGVSEMRETMFEIFNHLVATFTDAGLPLKPLETWMSEDLYIYGKIPIWKGVPLPMDVKKIMRMFPNSNADVMTLENALSTISGNALSSTQATSCIWTPYIVCLLMNGLCISDFLEYHPLLGRGLLQCTSKDKDWTLSTSGGERYTFKIRNDNKMTRRQLILLMQIIPRTLTGYNGVNILEMMMRGFPDNVSRDLSYIMSVLRSPETPVWLRRYIRNWIRPIYMPQINYATLVQDVTAVNLLSPRSPSSGIKQVVTRYLSSGVNIRNEEFRSLMLTKQKEHEEFLSELLCEGEDLHIRLIHDIMESTIYGYVDSILSKVVKTNTIQKLAMKSSSQDIFSTIEHDERTFFKFFNWRCYTAGDLLDSDCPTDMCREMRLIGWQKHLRGVTIPHPHSFMKESNCDHRVGCDCPDGYMSIHLPDGQLPNHMWMNSIGSNPPYLGSMTKEKVVVGAGGKVYSSEPLVKRPLNMLRSINWFVPQDSNTADIIKMLVSSISDIDPEPYIGMSEGVAGAELHRYRDSSTTHGALTSSSYLLSTRYHISSDHFHRYCRGSDNTDLHFQALYCYLVEMTNLEISKCIQNNVVIPRMKHYRQVCSGCIRKVQDDFVDLTNRRVLTAIPSRKSNPYLYVEASKIRILESRSPLSRLNSSYFTHDEYEAMSARRKRLWLQDVLIDKIICDISGQSLTDHTMESSLLDNKSFERTMYTKLDPKYMIDGVMGGLSMLAEWNWLGSTGHHKELNKGELARSIITMLTNAGSSGFIGLGMFYCWPSSAEAWVNTYPEIVIPDTNPISIDSCCNSVRTSMISLALKKTWHPLDRFRVIADDEKSSMWVMRRFLYNELSTRSHCVDCKRSVVKLNQNDINRLRFIQCNSHHTPFSQVESVPWRHSYATIERLRKDCDSCDRIGVMQRRKEIKWTGCNTMTKAIFKSSDIIIRPEAEAFQVDDVLPKFPDGFHCVSYHQIFAVDTVPTRTRSKYIVLLGPFVHHINGKGVFVLGDGLGGTSDTLKRLGASKIITSTLLDPGKAIPQTYVHNITPGLITQGRDLNIDSTLMIDKINDITDSRWVVSWSECVKDTRVCISDIELYKREQSKERCQSLMSILSVNNWDFVVVKDYLYSASDMSNSIKIITSASPDRFSLITCELRSSTYPECWWVIHGTKKISKMALGLDTGKISRIWLNYLEIMTDESVNRTITGEEADFITSLNDTGRLHQMLSHVRSWLSLPVIGLMFPDKGSYTRIYYYLKRTKQPEYVKLQRFENKLKLYDKDYYRLRDLLLCLALSMCDNLNVVIEELGRTENWYLDWEEKEKGSWDCILCRSIRPEGFRARIEDYVPILRHMMIKENLRYRSIGKIVRFKSVAANNNDKVVFRISRMAGMTSAALVRDKRYQNL
ncbi:TPA_asm: L [Artemisia alphacytorhabdovirus 3]|nr:TPA_asm: L [Artemisia alphacytorhabdovirus 3]